MSDKYETELQKRLYVTEGYEVENDLLLVIGVSELVKFVAPRLSKKDHKLGQQCLQRLSRSLGQLRIIDTEFRARSIPFLPTSSIPAFLERLRKLDADCKVHVAEGFRAFKLNALAKNCMCGFRDLKALERQASFYRSRTIDGFLLCPGEMILKSIAHILNLYGKRVPGWTLLNYDRLIEMMLGLLSHTTPARLMTYNSSTERSWAAMK